MNSPRRQPGRRPIQIDRDTTSAESEQVCRRLRRIEANYAELDRVLTELELKIETDEQLQELVNRPRDVRHKPKPR